MIKKISVNFCYILSFFSIFLFSYFFYQPLIGDDIFVFYDVKIQKISIHILFLNITTGQEDFYKLFWVIMFLKMNIY